MFFQPLRRNLSTVFFKYGHVLVNGTAPAHVFPLTLTLSPIGGEGIEQDPR